MSITTKSHDAPDPRRRYHAVAAGFRASETPYELALEALLHGDTCDTSLESAVFDGVTAALTSYENPTVRRLFDAALLGRATDEELHQSFDVAIEEARAYRHLFFDLTVFPNAFHVVAWIGQEPDVAQRDFLREAHLHGFRTLRFRFAPGGAPSAVEALERMLEIDARQFVDVSTMSMSDDRQKNLVALRKGIVTTTQALGKAGAAVAAAAPESSTEDSEFVLQSRPANPTIDELLARGIEVQT